MIQRGASGGILKGPTGKNARRCGGGCRCDNATSPGTGPAATLSGISGISFSTAAYDVGGGLSAVLDDPSAPSFLSLPAGDTACDWRTGNDDGSWGTEEEGGFGPGSYYSPPDPDPLDGSLGLGVTVKKVGSTAYIAVWDHGSTTAGDPTAATKHLLVFYGTATLTGCCAQSVSVANVLASGDLGSDFAGTGPFAGTSFVVAGYGGTMTLNLKCLCNVVAFLVSFSGSFSYTTPGTGTDLSMDLSSLIDSPLIVMRQNYDDASPPWGGVILGWPATPIRDGSPDTTYGDHAYLSLAFRFVGGVGLPALNAGLQYNTTPIPAGTPIYTATVFSHADFFPLEPGSTVAISNTLSGSYTGGTLHVTPICSNVTFTASDRTYSNASHTDSLSMTVDPDSLYKTWYAQLSVGPVPLGGASPLLTATTGSGFFPTTSGGSSDISRIPGGGNGGYMDWLRITSATSGVAPYTLTWEVDANATGSTRTAYIVVNSVYVKITQGA